MNIKIDIFTMYLYFLSFVPISFLLQNFIHRFKMMRGNGQKTFVWTCFMFYRKDISGQ